MENEKKKEKLTWNKEWKVIKSLFSLFSGEAMLLGDQHYKTFDGTHYVYAGKCSFMLAQDFVDNNFTIAVEYSRKEGVMSKSFTVISDGNTFEIKDGRVKWRQFFKGFMEMEANPPIIFFPIW